MGFFKKLFGREKKEKLDNGLKKTKEGFFGKITRAIAGKSKVDDELLDNLEEALISSDVGVDTTVNIIHRLRDRVEKDKFMNTQELSDILAEEICDMIGSKGIGDDDRETDFAVDKSKGTPYVIMVVGVNGVGKTTSIGKIAAQLKADGKKVVVAAADTFRAAAIDQLAVWCDRAGVDLIKQSEGSDPAAVVYDAVSAAKGRNADVLIVDTAGRLHNKKNLMDELNKMRRVIDREFPEADVRCMLVLDATTGQNGLAQARAFKEVCEIGGIILTKLDGTAKGGIALAIRQELEVPVWYIGVGEGIDDLQPFNAKDFVEALF